MKKEEKEETHTRKEEAVNIAMIEERKNNQFKQMHAVTMILCYRIVELYTRRKLPDL